MSHTVYVQPVVDYLILDPEINHYRFIREQSRFELIYIIRTTITIILNKLTIVCFCINFAMSIFYNCLCSFYVDWINYCSDGSLECKISTC